MPSKKSADPLDTFEKDVPITDRDIAAQWEIREGATMSSKVYLAWCTWISRDSVAGCRDFHTERFEL
ncbi:MAG TPA: hypothetical protein VMT00_08025 [Thermoanaerobaculia bacterium]|nr:hypothetical protein [Thermoanaerobaculia bacterium]